MAVRFPPSCKLSTAEQSVLKTLLSDGESPCDDCTWAKTCDGPEKEKAAAEVMFNDPEHRGLLCGGEVVRTTESKLISGVFRFCKEEEDEFVFDPLESLESVKGRSPVDVIDF